MTRDNVYINNDNITEKNWYSILNDITSIFSTSTDDVSNIAPRVFDIIWLENTEQHDVHNTDPGTFLSLLTCYGFYLSFFDTGITSLMPPGSYQ